MDTLAEEFVKDGYLLEMCRMKYQMTKTELESYIEQFRVYLHAIDEHMKIRRDFKPHFLNWLNINVYKDRQRQQEEGYTAPSIEPTEAQLQRIAELYPDNDAFLVKAYRKYLKQHNLPPGKGLEHFERAKREGWNYYRILFRIDEQKPIFKE